MAALARVEQEQQQAALAAQAPRAEEAVDFRQGVLEVTLGAADGSPRNLGRNASVSRSLGDTAGHVEE